MSKSKHHHSSKRHSKKSSHRHPPSSVHSRKQHDDSMMAPLPAAHETHREHGHGMFHLIVFLLIAAIVAVVVIILLGGDDTTTGKATSGKPKTATPGPKGPADLPKDEGDGKSNVAKWFSRWGAYVAEVWDKSPGGKTAIIVSGVVVLLMLLFALRWIFSDAYEHSNTEDLKKSLARMLGEEYKGENTEDKKKVTDAVKKHITRMDEAKKEQETLRKEINKHNSFFDQATSKNFTKTMEARVAINKQMAARFIKSRQTLAKELMVIPGVEKFLENAGLPSDFAKPDAKLETQRRSHFSRNSFGLWTSICIAINVLIWLLYFYVFKEKNPYSVYPIAGVSFITLITWLYWNYYKGFHIKSDGLIENVVMRKWWQLFATNSDKGTDAKALEAEAIAFISKVRADGDKYKGITSREEGKSSKVTPAEPVGSGI